MAFYEFRQNNSGGSFQTDENLTHYVIVEADTYEQAVEKGEELGIYFNGCETGYDCPCCGDRWYYPDEISVMNNYKAYEWKIGTKKSSEERWFKNYGNFKRKSEPVWEQRFNQEQFGTEIDFETLENYIQYTVDRWGWCSPDAYIHYANGTKKEFYKTKTN